MSKVRCYICKELGHMAKNCPKKKPKARVATATVSCCSTQPCVVASVKHEAKRYVKDAVPVKPAISAELSAVRNEPHPSKCAFGVVESSNPFACLSSSDDDDELADLNL